MLPSISIRLDNLIKALECTIVPAIAPDNGLAQEQAALSIGHLGLIKEQWDKALRFEQGTLNRLTAVAGKILSMAQGGTETARVVIAIEQTLDEMGSSLFQSAEETSQWVNRLGAQIENMLDAAEDDGNKEFIGRLEALVLNYSQIQALRERAWFQAAGMDPEQQELPNIEDIL